MIGMLISAKSTRSIHCDGSPVRYLPPFDVDIHIREHRSRFDSLRIAALAWHGRVLQYLMIQGLETSRQTRRASDGSFGAVAVY